MVSDRCRHLIVTLLLLLLTSNLLAENAIALNTRGYQAYQAGDYAKALALFRQAVKEDPTYGQAHYNLACTLGVLRQTEGPCVHDAYLNQINDSLLATLRYLPSKRGKMLKDPDLIPVHSTFAWQKIRGLSTETTADVRQILVAVAWFGPAPGAHGPIGGFDFHEDGRFTHWYLDFSGEISRQSKSGRYEVDANRVTFLFEGAPDQNFEGTLTRDGLLLLEGEHAPQGPYSDDPSDCSA
jgi:tetratricopeptide (TPR) repeat protein